MQPVMSECKYIEFSSSATVIKPPSLDPEFIQQQLASTTSLCLFELILSNNFIMIIFNIRTGILGRKYYLH